jgi:hypothetical protein
VGPIEPSVDDVGIAINGFGRMGRLLLRTGRRRAGLRFGHIDGLLTGTVLSGLLYGWQGLEACLWAPVAAVLGAALISLLLPSSTAAADAHLSVPQLVDGRPSVARRRGRRVGRSA